MNMNILMIGMGFTLTGLSYLLATAFGVPVDLNWLEIIAVATSYSCTILFMLQKRAAYFYGIVSTFFLCLLFFTQGMMALSLFNGILVLSLVYGWFRWGPDGKPLAVSWVKTEWKAYAGYMLFFLAVCGLFRMIVGEGSTLDLTLAAGSATAQLMLDNKRIENWLVWIVINVFSIGFFLQEGLILLAIQFMMFLVNAMVALYRWHKDLKKEVV